MSNVEAIKAAAAHLVAQGTCEPGNRVFISDVIDALLSQNPGWTEARIKAEMRTMEREVVFATGDLIEAEAYTAKLARSRTVVRTYRDHAVFVIPM